jgi:hypothetical protein
MIGIRWHGGFGNPQIGRLNVLPHLFYGICFIVEISVGAGWGFEQAARDHPRLLWGCWDV